MIRRFRFSEVFQQNPDGYLSPIRQVEVNGITFGPDVSFGPGASFGGVDFHNYKYSDIAAEEINGVLHIRGFYKD